jgi:Lsr2
VALKRVCDITGTDRDVEICDVTIAGQSIKLDLSPAGAEKLRDFFGPVVTVRHPLVDGGPVEPEAAPRLEVVDGGEDAEEEAEAEPEAAEEEEVFDEEAAASVPQRMERPARRGGRRPASVTKGARKKTVSRRAAKPVASAASQATAEIREWARANGFEVGERGAIPGRIRSAYTLAHE